MRFGPVAPSNAAGAILAHSVGLPAGRLRKGRLLTAADCAALEAAGIGEVWTARPEDGDVPEDEAAAALAQVLVPNGGEAGLRAGPAATGRVNIHAVRPGLLMYEASSVHALNRVDPGVTFAALAPYARVAEGQLVGTIKVIPYAIPAEALAAGGHEAGTMGLHVRPVNVSRVTLLETLPSGAGPSLKGERAVRGRLEALGAGMDPPRRVPHAVPDLAGAIADSDADAILILTATATSDLRDVAPEALRAAGGTVDRFGMPVDPGNLLFVGSHRGRPVVGLPGCARSPALNGADWVLDRVLTGLPCGDDEIAKMGVGGLLKESPARGRPREP